MTQGFHVRESRRGSRRGLQLCPSMTFACLERPWQLPLLSLSQSSRDLHLSRALAVSRVFRVRTGSSATSRVPRGQRGTLPFRNGRGSRLGGGGYASNVARWLNSIRHQLRPGPWRGRSCLCCGRCCSAPRWGWGYPYLHHIPLTIEVFSDVCGETIKLGREQVNRLYESANENFVKRRGGKGATVSHLIWKRGINSLGESLLPLFGTFWSKS